MTVNNTELLGQFVLNRSEEEFALLTSRYLDLVYSAALRQVRSPQNAQDVTQSVFLELWKNAHKLKPDTILSSWLYCVTRRTAVDLIRSESRRKSREQTAVQIAELKSPDGSWDRIEPLLDEAMQSLTEAERNIILHRYFEKKSMQEVGEILEITADAAQKRVSRALDRLREFLCQKGVSVSAGGLASILPLNSVHATPAGCTTAVCAYVAKSTTALTAAAKSAWIIPLRYAFILLLLSTGIGTMAFYALKHSTGARSLNSGKEGQAMISRVRADLQVRNGIHPLSDGTTESNSLKRDQFEKPILQTTFDNPQENKVAPAYHSNSTNSETKSDNSHSERAAFLYLPDGLATNMEEVSIKGSWLFHESEFKFIDLKLWRELHAPGTIAPFLKLHLSEPLKLLLSDYLLSPQSPPGQAIKDATLQAKLGRELNKLLSEERLYGDGRAEKMNLSFDTTKLFSQVKPEKPDVRLNRLILEDAFPLSFPGSVRFLTATNVTYVACVDYKQQFVIFYDQVGKMISHADLRAAHGWYGGLGRSIDSSTLTIDSGLDPGRGVVTNMGSKVFSPGYVKSNDSRFVAVWFTPLVFNVNLQENIYSLKVTDGTYSGVPQHQ